MKSLMKNSSGGKKIANKLLLAEREGLWVVSAVEACFIDKDVDSVCLNQVSFIKFLTFIKKMKNSLFQKPIDELEAEKKFLA